MVPLGGNHSRAARYKLCEELAGGDFDKLGMLRHKTSDGLTTFPYRNLCWTQAEVCFDLPAADIRMVSSPRSLRTGYICRRGFPLTDRELPC